VQILSDNRSNYRDGNFLSGDFPRNPPKLYITGENDDFDEITLREWRDEGFDVEYISMESCGDGYLKKIKSLSRENMGPCEKFGIVGESRLSRSFSTEAVLIRSSLRRRRSCMSGTLPRFRQQPRI
jgi:hypothetical protein